jgi:hypothetical protein
VRGTDREGQAGVKGSESIEGEKSKIEEKEDKAYNGDQDDEGESSKYYIYYI